jgi:pimeloyl-ACP methyl ester carboxylesterase
MKTAMEVPWLLEILLTVPLSPGSARMPAREARRAIDDLAGATAFDETFEHTRTPFCRSHIKAPVTVAFGDRDWILPQRSRWREGLSRHTTWVDQPRWGHVPMWVDPTGVAALILEGTDANRVHATAVGMGRAQI